jgi:hypothetical protein
MDMVKKNCQMVTPMKANIVKVSLMVMAFMYGKTEQLTKEHL